MPKKHKVKQGDCISSIATAHGMLPDTLWEHGDNADLREARRSPNALAPGDVVVIPDPGQKEYSLGTDASHKFVHTGIPEDFVLVLKDEDGEPRTEIPFSAEVPGQDAPIEGTSDGDGLITFPLHPLVRKLKLTLTVDDYDGEDVLEVHEITLGGVDPVDTALGVRHRLVNLGYVCKENGDFDENLAGALREFQSDAELDVTGEFDDATEGALVERYGC